MNREQLFFLQVLSDHINKQKTIIPENIDWNTIKRYAAKHQVEGIFYAQTKRNEFKQAFIQIVYTYQTRKRELQCIFACMQDEEIEFVPVKGTILSDFYPIPELRTMGDVDIVVHSRDREKVHLLLLNQGYICKDKGEYEWSYYKNGVAIEVHDHLLYRTGRNTNAIVDFDSQMWNNVEGQNLNWNYHFIYLFLHLRKHFVGEGVGFRQFFDIAVLSQANVVDWDIALAWMKKIGIEDFGKTVLSFNNKWFHVSSPIEPLNISDHFFLQSTNKVFENGVFGVANVENKTNLDAFEQINHGFIGSVQRLFKDTFYPYEKLKKMSEYSYLNDRRWLLPIAWVRRIFCKLKNGKEIKEYYFIPLDKVEARKDLLEQWGIIKH